MRKSTRLLKRLLALSLVLILSIESFAAVVSDNDGAAFVTKAEFESLRSDFNKQINQYNTSIDNKIDGAISTYLQGVVILAKPMLYLPSCKAAVGRNPFFRNSIPGTGSSYWTTAISVQKSKNYSTQYKLGTTQKQFVISGYQTGNGDAGIFGFPSATETWSSREYKRRSENQTATWVFWTYSDTFTFKLNTGSVGSSTYNNVAGNMITLNKSWSNASGATTGSDYTFNGTWQVCMLNNTFVKAELRELATIYGTINGTQTMPVKNRAVNNVSLHASASRDGFGSAWQYRVSPWGTKILERYYTLWYPTQMITLNYKTYKNFTSTLTTVAANALLDNQTCTYTPSLTAAYGIQTVGTNYTTYNTTNLAGYCQQNVVLTKSSTDTNNYEIAQWGTNTTTDLYTSLSEPTLTKSTTNLASSYTNLAAGTVSIEGVNHSVTGVTNNVYQITATPTVAKLDTFEVNSYTGIAGETVYVGGGMPFAYTQSAAGETTFNISFKTTTDAGATQGSTPVKWMLSTAQFKDGNYANASDKLAEGTVTTNSSGVATITTTLDDLPNHQLIWLNAYSTTANRIVEVTDCSSTVR